MIATLIRLAIAIAAAWIVWRAGRMVLRGFAQPALPPPELGTLRKVNLRYRCEICGTEVKMTMATEELPPPPRHCLDEMQLVAPPF
jgi:hypothetical protein